MPFTDRHTFSNNGSFLLWMAIFITVFDTSFEIYRMSCRKDALFKLSARNSKLQVIPISMVAVDNLSLCARMCIHENTCKSINYNVFNKSCEILSKNKSDVGNDMIKNADNWRHYEPIIYEVCYVLHSVIKWIVSILIFTSKERCNCLLSVVYGALL